MGHRRGSSPLGLKVVWVGQRIPGDILDSASYAERHFTRPLKYEPIAFDIEERVHQFTYAQVLIDGAKAFVNGTMYRWLADDDSESLSYQSCENILMWNLRFAITARSLGVPYIFLSNGLPYSNHNPIDRTCGMPPMPTDNDIALVHWRAEADALAHGGFVLRVPELFRNGLSSPLEVALNWEVPVTSNGRRYLFKGSPVKQRLIIPQQMTAMAHARIVGTQIYECLLEIVNDEWLHLGRIRNLGHREHEVFSWGDLILSMTENVANADLVFDTKKKPNMYFAACEGFTKTSLLDAALKEYGEYGE